MIKLRRSAERGQGGAHWLDSKFSFSFAHYYDPQHMGFRNLRVINEDVIAGGGGFPLHPHNDMEIITWVLDGAIEHRDTLGHVQVSGPGDIQVMTAGRGIAHSEFNAGDKPLHLLQIWVLPRARGLEPTYRQRSFDPAGRAGRLQALAVPVAGNDNPAEGADQPVAIEADAALYATELAPGQRVQVPLAAGRAAWVQVTKGSLTVNGQRLDAGDGAAIEGEPEVTLEGVEPAAALLFDLGR